jgi:hypothetical protein
MLKDDPNHFGHSSNNPPQRNIIKKWASVRDLDDLYLKSGKQENDKKLLDLTALGFDKLLGGGQVKNAFSIKIGQFTSKAEEKVKNAGGELLNVTEKEPTSKKNDKQTAAEDIDEVRQNTHLPIILGSGATPGNLPVFLPKIDSLIVGSYFKKEGRAANQVVPHLHIHLVPRWEGDGLTISEWEPVQGDLDEIQATADAIKSRL